MSITVWMCYSLRWYLILPISSFSISIAKRGMDWNWILLQAQPDSQNRGLVKGQLYETDVNGKEHSAYSRFTIAIHHKHAPQGLGTSGKPVFLPNCRFSAMDFDF